MAAPTSRMNHKCRCRRRWAWLSLLVAVASIASCTSTVYATKSVSSKAHIDIHTASDSFARRLQTDPVPAPAIAPGTGSGSGSGEGPGTVAVATGARGNAESGANMMATLEINHADAKKKVARLGADTIVTTLDGWEVMTDPSALSKFEASLAETSATARASAVDSIPPPVPLDPTAASGGSSAGAMVAQSIDGSDAATTDAEPSARYLQEDETPATVAPAEAASPAEPASSGSSFVFVANRRVTFNNFSHGFIGGTEEEYPFETDTLTANERHSVQRTSSGDMLIKSEATSKFWGLDTEKNRIIWVDEAEALALKVFINPTKDAVIFCTADGMFVSFRSFDMDQLGGERQFVRSLAVVSVITESAVFSAASASNQPMAITKYIVQSRRGPAQAKTVSRPFLAYDMAFAPLFNINYATFLITGCTEVDLNLIVVTMAQVMVTHIPEYAAQYPSFGATLPILIDLNAFASANSIGTEVAKTVSDGISFFSLMPAQSDNKDMARAAAFAQAVIQRAVLYDLDSKKNKVFSGDKTTYQHVINLHYRASCRLAMLMDNRTLADKMNYTEILFEKQRKEPFVGKDDNGAYWFNGLINRDVKDVRTINILPELGLFKYLKKEFIEKETQLGDGIADAIIDEVTALAGKNDIKGLAMLGKHENFVAAAKRAGEFCSQGTSTIKFCVLPKVTAQVAALVSSDQSLFTMQTPTALENNVETLRNRINTLLEKKKEEGLLNLINKKKNEMMDFLKKNVDTIAKELKDDALEKMMSNAKAQAEYQKQLSKHLNTTALMDTETRKGEFNQKMKAMRKGIETAESHQKDMMEAIQKLSKKADQEAAFQTMVDFVSTAISAMQCMNPAVSYRGGGDLLNNANELSKSMLVTESTTGLGKRIKGEFTKEVVDIIQRMAQYASEVNKLHDTVKPLISTGDSVNDANLKQNAAAFLAAYTNFKSPVTMAEVERIRAFMSEVVDALCIVIDIDGYNPCITVPAKVVHVFGSLSESVGFGLEAIAALFEVATSAMNGHAATEMGTDAAKQLEVAKKDKEDLLSKWGGDDKKKEAWWAEWKKQQNYSIAVASISLVLNQALLLNTVVQFCNANAYLAGGKADPICAKTVFGGAPISEDEIVMLSTSSDITSPKPVEFQAFLPTRPYMKEDGAFIDLARLMNGETVSFRVPPNEKWLKSLGWEVDYKKLKTTVWYVTGLELYLPPRFDNFMTSPKITKVKVESTGESDYGLAVGGKRFTIAKEVDNGRYSNLYKLQTPTSQQQCDEILLEGLSSCSAKLPRLCSMSPTPANTKGKILPSLFSPFTVTATFGDQKSANLLRYTDVTSEFFIHVRVRLSAYENIELLPQVQSGNASIGITPDVGAGSGSSTATDVDVGDTEETTSETKEVTSDTKETTPTETKEEGKEDTEIDDFSLRRLAEDEDEEDDESSGKKKSDRCCPVGQYKHLIKGECLPCPAGSVSQMGGYYCVAVSDADLKGGDKAPADEERVRRKLRHHVHHSSKQPRTVGLSVL